MKNAKYVQCVKCHRIVTISYYGKIVTEHKTHDEWTNNNLYTVKCYDEQYYNSDPKFGDHINKLE